MRTLPYAASSVKRFGCAFENFFHLIAMHSHTYTWSHDETTYIGLDDTGGDGNGDDDTGVASVRWVNLALFIQPPFGFALILRRR